MCLSAGFSSKHGNFYSRPSARGDVLMVFCCFRSFISTHAPLRGATRRMACMTTSSSFLLTPLCEGRPVSCRRSSGVRAISTHAPLRGATPMSSNSGPSSLNFYSRPSARGDGLPFCSQRPDVGFLLTPLCEGRPVRLSLGPLLNLFLLTPLCEGRPRIPENR